MQPKESLLLGSSTADPLINYDGRFAPIRQTEGLLHVLGHYWNPSTLDYEVGTSGGEGVGTEVEVTNWPSSFAVTTRPRTTTASGTYFAASTSATTLVSSNSARVGWIVYNNSTATLYLKYGGSASSSDFTAAVLPYATARDDGDGYIGVISGAWSSATGGAYATELT